MSARGEPMSPGKPSAAAVQSPLCAPRNSVSVIAPTLWLIAVKSADCLPIVEVTETNKHMEADLLQIESRGWRKGEGGRNKGHIAQAEFCTQDSYCAINVFLLQMMIKRCTVFILIPCWLFRCDAVRVSSSR